MEECMSKIKENITSVVYNIVNSVWGIIILTLITLVNLSYIINLYLNSSYFSTSWK